MNIKKHIPNTITCLNIISGGLSVIFAFEHNFDLALLCIVAASVFDFMDGLAARLLKAYSETGKELDSLCDVVSFGFAPAMILFNFLRGHGSFSFSEACIPLVIAAFSALRLAKFNLDTRQTEGFLGLPVPANALLIASAISFAGHSETLEHLLVANRFIIPVIVMLLSLLLVSEIPMFSLKLKSLKWAANKERYCFLLITIPVAILLPIYNIHFSGILFFIFGFYLLWNLAAWFVRKLRH